MILELLGGIAGKLEQEFGSGYTVLYAEDSSEELTGPGFFLAVTRSLQTPRLGLRSFCETQFEVRYIPQTPGNYLELYDAAERLLQVLEYIYLPSGDAVRGTSLSCEVEEGLLKVLVSYNVYLLREAETPPGMEELTVKQNVYGGMIE